jgi:hypothetical protein
MVDADILSLPTRNAISELEQMWFGCGPAWLESREYVLDMSRCESFDAPGVIYILSRLVQRRRINLATRLRLPIARQALESLMDWGFESAARDALGVPFHKLELSRDPSNNDIGCRAPTAKSWTPVSILPTSLFPIETFFAGSREFGYTLASHQARKWLSGYMISALTRHLSSAAPQIGTHVIHEACRLAIESGAQIIQTAAHYGAKTTQYERSLIIVFWDDGRSLLDGTGALNLADEAAELSQRPLALTDGETGQTTILKKPANYPDPTVRRVQQLIDTISPVDQARSGASASVGIQTLCNVVRDVFGGDLSIRTKNIVVTLKPKETKLLVYGQRYPSICGNLLAITIPLK